MEDKKTALSFLQKLKTKAENQVHYGGETPNNSAAVSIKDCPNCGAGRAKQEGLTHCAYCGFEFIGTQLTDGLHIKKDDNSQLR